VDFLVNGSPRVLYESEIDRIRLQPEWPVVETVLLGPEEAVGRFARQMKWGFGVVYVVIAVALLGLSSAASPVDRELLGWLVPTALAALACIAPIAYFRNLRRFRERIETACLPAPSGSTMRVSEAGLLIAGRALMPWSAWASVRINLLSVANRSGAFLVIQRISLAAPGVNLDLDWDNSSNGRSFVDNVFHRLRAKR